MRKNIIESTDYWTVLYVHYRVSRYTTGKTQS